MVSFNDEVRADIARVVRDIVVRRGHPVPPQLTDTTRPIGDVPGFDVDAGAEATKLLEEACSAALGDNVFLSWKGTRPLTVHEIVHEVMTLVQHGF